METAQTGATPEQIEAAAFKAYRNTNLTADDYGEYAEWAMGEAYRFASALVPVGYAIVRTDDVRAVLEFIGDDERYAGTDGSGAIERLREACGE